MQATLLETPHNANIEEMSWTMALEPTPFFRDTIRLD